jgi:N-acetylglutamate synthase-like GNAT family acetyltransferase
LLDSWYSPESLSRALAAQGSSFFVAESSGEVIGFAQFVRRSSESVELTRIYVLQDGQRSGIGMRLRRIYAGRKPSLAIFSLDVIRPSGIESSLL